jgi:hypothetical protein
LPGSTSKYTVRYDPVSDRYWALTSGGINRGELNLYSARSVDGKVGDFEFELKVLEGHSTSYHGFNYPFLQFDGDDIVFTLRTAWDHHRGTSDRWHDADLFSFHRVPNFRVLGAPHGPVNFGFEEGMAGWLTDGDADADYTQTTNPHSGTNNLAHYKSSAYQVRTYQLVSLPDGTYTASAWVKCSGGQNQCHLYVSGYGGTEIRTNIPASSTAYVKIAIPGIKVTSGVCNLGIYSDANAGNWVTVDDVELAVPSSLPSAPGFPIDAIQVSSGTVSLTATGAIGSTYKLWATTNLAFTPVPSTWTLLTNGTITVNPFTITDPGAVTNQQRFYLFSAP